MAQGQQGYQVIVYSLGAIPAVLLGKVGLPPELAVVAPPVTVFTSMFKQRHIRLFQHGRR